MILSATTIDNGFLFPDFSFMLRKKDYEAELRKSIDKMNARKSHTQEELDVIGRNMPVRVMQNCHTLAKFCVENNLSLTDSFIILAWVVSQFPFLNDIRVTNDITYDDACKFYETARVNTIVIHRLNYVMHDATLAVYDILEREGKMRFTVKKEMNEAERVWNVYVGEHRKAIERTAWSTLQDHLRLTNDTLMPYIEKVYESIRDYMIRLGMRDVEVKARCQVALLLMKVVGHSFKAFFRDFERECGADYTKCFEIDDTSAIDGHFASLCNAIGIRTEKDQYGYYVLAGFDPEQSQRFRWAWNDLIRAFRDDDLMDEAAKKAIGLNPEVQKEYSHILEEKEREVFEEGVDRLSEKFNVKKGL